jgi:hypothetical protein
MRSDVPAEEPGLASQAQDRNAERDLPAARRAWRSQRAFVPGDYAGAISLMDRVGRTEKDIAATLRAMAGEGKERSQGAAAEAGRGGQGSTMDAAEHAVQLQRQAGQWAEHAGVVALLQSVHHAGRVLTHLACAEKDLAATLTSVASHATPIGLRSCGIWRTKHWPTRGTLTTGRHPCMSWRRQWSGDITSRLALPDWFAPLGSPCSLLADQRGLTDNMGGSAERPDRGGGHLRVIASRSGVLPGAVVRSAGGRGAARAIRPV